MAVKRRCLVFEPGCAALVSSPVSHDVNASKHRLPLANSTGRTTLLGTALMDAGCSALLAAAEAKAGFAQHRYLMRPLSGSAWWPRCPRLTSYPDSTRRLLAFEPGCAAPVSSPVSQDVNASKHCLPLANCIGRAMLLGTALMDAGCSAPLAAVEAKAACITLPATALSPVPAPNCALFWFTSCKGGEAGCAALPDGAAG